MFEIKTLPFGKLELYQLLNPKTGETASIIPGYGACLNELKLKKSGVIFDLINGSLDYDQLLGEGTLVYKSSLLYPYPNRIKGGIYTYKGRIYQFDINDADGRQNSLHGFAYNAEFKVIEQKLGAESAEITMEYQTDGTHAAFPFQSKLTLTYLFDQKGLTQKSSILNIDEKPFPVGLGWHPYFKTGTKIDKLELRLPQHQTVPTDSNLIPTGKLSNGFTFNVHECIEDVELDNGYFLTGQSELSEVEIRDPEKDITLSIWLKRAKMGYNYLQIYTPKDRNSIAIEPQTCATDAFNNKMGLIELEPGQGFSCEWGVGLS